MIEITRKEFKHDPVFRELWQSLKKNHKVADHTQKTLFKNRHTKDFCVESRHFLYLAGKNVIYLHYDVATWFQEPNKAPFKIESIAVYDDFMEYETARNRGLHSGREADIPNIN